MSRIGKKPIEIPNAVEIKMEGQIATVKGPLGTLSYSLPAGISIKIQDSKVVVARETEQKQHKALHGLVRSLLNNMVTGVSVGFSKSLEISGIGYRVKKEGNLLNLVVGYSHPVDFPIPTGIAIDVDGQTKMTVKGIDKQLVGQVAADIRQVRKPEPYKGKGIRYSNEVIRRKEGKTGA